MPSHIYERTGRYAEATKSNIEAAAADRAYLSSTGARKSIYGAMYYSHNLQFLSIAAGMEGNFSAAKMAADQLAANVSPAVKQMPMLEAMLAVPAFVMTRFQRWDEILNLPAPDPSQGMALAAWHYARGVAFAAKRETSKALAEREQLAAIVKSQPGDALAGLNSTAKVLGLGLEVLDARVSAGQGERDAAISHWRRAVALEDGLAYNEPPDWYYPVRESLGGELARAGRYAEAEKVFRDDLSRNPRNPRSLFGLMKTLEAQKKTADAQLIKKQFDEAWKNADVTLRIEDL
jgi:tetratricopeptide (TPR) repeat protein